MPTAARTLPRLAGVLLLLTGAYVALRAYPADLTVPASARRADLIATVLYDQAMVFVLRVLIICAAAFTVLSIGVRIWNREWLTKAGPFEVERTVERAERERDDLKAQLAQLHEEFARLVETTWPSRPGTALGDDCSLGRRTDHVTH